MALIDVPRILLTGFEDQEIVRNIGIGLVHELRKKGHSVACATTSPDIAASAVLERLSSRPVSCFYPELLNTKRIGALACVAVSGADFLIILGACDLGELNSLDQKVIEASSCSSISVCKRKGMKPFDPRIKIDAQILISDSERKDEDLIGTIKVSEAFSQDKLGDTYLGAAPNISRGEILRLATLVEEKLDLDKLETLARKAEAVEVKGFNFAPQRRKTRFAVARDGCFSGGFSDNLMLLRYFGADIAEFSPIADTELPKDVGGLYLPASFLKDYGRALSENIEIRKSILEFAQSGGVVFSEGPSSAYLCQSFRLEDDDTSHLGVGLIPAQAFIRGSELTPVEVLVKEDCVLGYPGLLLKSLLAKSWRIHAQENLVTVFEVTGSRSETNPEGYSPGAQVVSTFSLPHFGTCREAAYNLVTSAEVVRSLG